MKWCVCQFLEKQFLPFGCRTETLFDVVAGDPPSSGAWGQQTVRRTQRRTRAVAEHKDAKTGGGFLSGQKVQRGVV